ncbi:MAG: tRNA uridine(34) 5-carboxymethylaminomethyl modification radical SAM/GNAT enzyme Elp3 [Promethearchaeota archaeon]
MVMGGTFLSTDLSYQESFIKGALEGIIGQKTSSLAEAKRKAENSLKRLVGITIETRPDYCKKEHVDLMLYYGTTRIEIGVQTVYDDIYKLIKRGHSTADSIEAIRIAKDAGLKINLHVMPNLPGSSLQNDLELFQTLFIDPNYRPDMLKIYPTLVIQGTELYNWWKEGRYVPYSEEELIDLLAYVKQSLPPYVRIQRIMRDIPAYLIQAGCKKSNLRQLIHEKLMEKNTSCRCIRCRELGYLTHQYQENEPLLNEIKLLRYEYEASEGKEIFLSHEDMKRTCLLGYLRLRIPSEKAHRKELNDGNTSIVREIKIVGMLVPRGAVPLERVQIQHKGLGKTLLKQAEKISEEEFGLKKIAVISGLGVKPWFYKQGYQKDGPYVSKKLN